MNSSPERYIRKFNPGTPDKIRCVDAAHYCAAPAQGVEVRAPTEMLEVAEDIRKQIDKITATGAPAARASSSSGT